MSKNIMNITLIKLGVTQAYNIKGDFEQSTAINNNKTRE